MLESHTLNPEHIKAIIERICASPFFRLISLRVPSLGWGSSRAELTIEEKHLQPWGRVQGSVYSALVDVAALWAVYTQIPEGKGVTTIELNVNYLAPASSGELISHGRALKVGKTIALSEASVYDGSNRLLAHGLATLMVLDSLSLEGNKPLPPKWL